MKYKLKSRNRLGEIKSDFFSRTKKAFSLTNPEKNYLVKKAGKAGATLRKKLTKAKGKYSGKNINFNRLFN